MNATAKITELRAKRRCLVSEAKNFINSPGPWNECREKQYRNDLAEIDALDREMETAVDTLVNLHGSEAIRTRIGQLMLDRQNLISNLKTDKNNQQVQKNGLEILKAINDEHTRIVDTLILIAHNGQL